MCKSQKTDSANARSINLAGNPRHRWERRHPDWARLCPRYGNFVQMLVLFVCSLSALAPAWPDEAPDGHTKVETLSDAPARFIVVLRSESLVDFIRTGRTLTAETALELTPDRMTKLQSIIDSRQQEAIGQLRKQDLIHKVGRHFGYLLNGFVVEARPSAKDLIASLPGVKAVYPDRLVSACRADETLTAGASDPGWAITDQSGNPVTGRGITVAVIDSGIDYTHSDLGGCLGPNCKVKGGYDFVNSDSDPLDDTGHGTHVAGIIGANGKMQGVAPDASLLAYKVLNQNGTGWSSDIIAAIERALNPDGNPSSADRAHVINMSLGAPTLSTQDPMTEVVNRAVDLGVVVVVAAGNKGPFYGTVSTPGTAAKAITVGSTTFDLKCWTEGSRGPLYDFSIKPDLIAPGSNIRSTVPGGTYRSETGTSMAAPHVAGAVALLRQAHPSWTPQMIKAVLMNTADPSINDCFTAGTGLMRADRAVASETVVSPASLSFGKPTIPSSGWKSEKKLQITNLSRQRRGYSLSLEDLQDLSGNPVTGVSLKITPVSVSVESGQSAEVTVELSVAAGAPLPAVYPFAYQGLIRLDTSSDQVRIPFALGRVPAPPLGQRQALVALYDATGGSNWRLKANWLGPEGSEGTWHGVRIFEGHVVSINLQDNGLTGSIPPDISNLKSLYLLNVAGNQLSGGLPSLKDLTGLAIFSVIDNQISGTIPLDFSTLPRLAQLGLGFNQFTGSIPKELGQCKRLAFLNLESNRLTGTIPAELGSLAELKSLELATNELSGSIPKELGSLKELRSLGLSNNNLSGSLPAELGNLKQLEYMGFNSNEITGSLPSGLSQLSKLIWVYGQENKISGPLPSLGQLRSLTELTLSYNQLEGPLPPDLGSMESLVVLNLSSNKLSGSIPPGITQLSNLQELILWSNKLQGAIPEDIDKLKNLQGLALGSNLLTGQIPEAVTRLTDLEMLDASNNRLTGWIPADIGNLAELRTLTLDRNLLTGKIPRSMGKLQKLDTVHLENNLLTGSIPADLGNMSNLVGLYLMNNRLEGRLPAELGNLTKLQYMDIRNNRATGAIPTSFSQLKALKSLQLSYNNLTGTIPKELGSLSELEILELDNNHLSGEIPAEIGSLAKLRMLSLGRNHLMGHVPSTFAQLTALTDGYSDFRSNHLQTSDPILRAFLNKKQAWGDWETSQVAWPAIRGDMNGDSVSDLADLVAMIRAFGGIDVLGPEISQVADANGDGTFDARDLVQAVKRIKSGGQ